MPGPRARGLPVSTSRDRRQGVQHALLHTLPGRAIVIGLVARLGVYALALLLGSAPPFLRVIDTAAGVALAVGAAYFVVRLLVAAKRRLLWRVRRKLILSYFCIGFIPSILIVLFFLLCGYLLFYNFSAYLVQSRLRALADEARFLAQSTALEIQRGGGPGVPDLIATRQARAAPEFPGVSIAVVRMDRACADTATAPARGVAADTSAVAGPWSHVAPPLTVPRWIDCSGFAGMFAYSRPRPATQADAAAGTRAEDAHILLRATAFPDSPRPGYAVIVDVPVNEPIKQRLRGETGVVLKDVNAVLDATHDVRPIAGRADADRTAASSSGTGGGLLRDLPSLFEYRDWASGESGTLKVSMQLSVGELYDRISSVQGLVGRNFGQGLLLVLFIIGGLFLVIEFVALVAGLALAKSITGSVHQLFTGTERVRQGDFTHKIAVTTDDQLGELSVSFNSMTASIEDLLRQAAEKKRLEEELRIARQIQMSLLPQGPFEMRGLSVTALCVPAREVGGDYYDFFRIGARRLGILIADVSGKGTSAALYMAELKGLMLSLSQIHTSPRALMLAADRIIAANLDTRSFITMTYAVLDLDAGTMTYARAGHTPLMYVPGPASRLERQVRILAPDGLVLGLNIDHGEMFERLLEEHTLALHVGDLALFFTDGISEAMNENDDFFGEGRLGRLIEQHAHLSSEELRERVLREVQAFVGNAPQHDDMTMIFLKVLEVGAPTVIGAETPALVEY
jgi:sigma-B regulation protein RsbU (phosphoserine phosphatase)